MGGQSSKEEPPAEGKPELFELAFDQLEDEDDDEVPTDDLGSFGDEDELWARKPVDVPWDASWLSVACFYLLLPLNLVMAVLAGFHDGTLRWLSQMAKISVGCGRPIIFAWVMWWLQPAVAIRLIRCKKSRFALFSNMRAAFGGGDWWWHGEGVWSCPHASVSGTMASSQVRRPAFGAVRACSPEMFPPKILLFTDGAEWKAVRAVLVERLASRSCWAERLEKLPSVLALHAPPAVALPKVEKKTTDTMVAAAVWFMLFGVILSADECATVARWGASGYAGYFVFPRFVQRLAFNSLIKKVLRLRADTVAIVRRHKLESVFEEMNAALPPPHRRASALELCDELMYAVNFAGVGGTQHAAWAVARFLQGKTVDVPQESVTFPLDSATLLGMWEEDPDAFVKETCRLDCPVTSATCVLSQATSVAFGTGCGGATAPHPLPAGTLHQYALSIANRDAAAFFAPNVFDPRRRDLDRTLSWNGALSSPDKFPRMCPGQDLSVEIVKAVTSCVLQAGGDESTGIADDDDGSERSGAPRFSPSWPVKQPTTPRRPNYSIGCCKGVGIFLLAATAGPLALSVALSGTAAIGATAGALLVLPLAFIYFYLEAVPLPTDWYTKLLLFSYRRLYFARRPPTAADMDPAALRPRGPLRLVPIQYALDIQVPHGTDEEFTKSNVSLSGRLAVALEENLSRLPMRSWPDKFAPGEDPVAWVMERLGDIYPPVRDPWADKTSDRALARLCKHGIGAHRVEKEGSCFVVRTNALAELPVRPGLEHYGGDAYFDEQWRVVKIVRKRQRPDAPWAAAPLETFTPDTKSVEWEYAKFCFRSSLFSLVTLVDHLYAVHMQVGNAVVIASRLHLAAEHPLRRFLVPFTYQTISVNDNARNNLVNPRSMGPRNFAFTETGMQLAWAAAPRLVMGGAELSGTAGGPLEFLRLLLDRGRYIELKREQGVDTPYFQQALRFWSIMRRFVGTYIDFFYPSGADLAADAELVRFVSHALRLLEVADASSAPGAPALGDVAALPPELLREVVVNLLTRYCDVVTAGHEQVGTVPVYAQDVGFCSFRWEIGELVGSKQTAVEQATLMAFTSTPMPMLMAEPGSDGDWTHVFPTKEGAQPHQPLLDAFATFQSELRAMSADCQAYNAAAASRAFPDCYPLTCFDPKHLETSVSV